MSPRIRALPSPNQDDRPPGTPIDILVLHYTGMLTAEDAINRLRDPASRVSSHYVVEEDGTVWRLVDEQHRAWHAGVSYWRGHETLNDRSIGVEIVNPGHDWGYRDFSALQMAAVCDLCLAVLSHHSIPARNVVAHSDVAPDRKQDPGERFDWRGLAKNGVGLWPADAPRFEPSNAGQALDDVRAALDTIGYRPDLPLETVLRAFQLHWRAESVTGEADASTLARLAAVARLCRTA